MHRDKFAEELLNEVRERLHAGQFTDEELKRLIEILGPVAECSKHGGGIR